MFVIASGWAARAAAQDAGALRKVPSDDLDRFAGKPRGAAKAPRERPAARGSDAAVRGRDVAGTPAPVPVRTATAHTDAGVIGWQAALDRAGFSPGLIDGVAGAKTMYALESFQEAQGLATTGKFDAATIAALGVGSEPALTKYTVSAEDVESIGRVPTDWNEKAALDRLPYESMTALLAERGHCTQATLGRLNPGVRFERLRAGDMVTIPNVEPGDPLPMAAEIEVDLENKTVMPLDRQGRPVGLFHCSVAKFVEKLPRGQTSVIKVAFDPEYHFDPKMWPEVHTVRAKLIIPPGPRNPVGLAWIGLNLPGYGIHGTPTPELIGKTGSHGCIRLANWDAVRLAKAVRVGTPVRFVGS